jgi:putative ABC transport system permease protein
VRALNRLLARELIALRVQAITIALVVACGVAAFIACFATYDSLQVSRDQYYSQARFAELFVSLRRAPRVITESLQQIAGIEAAQTRLQYAAPLRLPSVNDLLFARLISLPESPGTAQVNRLTLRQGRWPEPESQEVLINEGFARARLVKPGDMVSAIIRGRDQTLTIVGIANSPEYILGAVEGAMPDDRSLALIWMDEKRLEAALDMRASFNSLVVTLADDAQPDAVIAALDQLLAPYGSRGAYSRNEQASHRALNQEIGELKVFGTVLPSIFVAVAGFIVQVVMNRLVSAQRQQIAAIKALGYTSTRIAAHYLSLTSLITASGCAAGLLLGYFLGQWLTSMYTSIFHFGSFQYRVSPLHALIPCTVTLTAALLAGLLAVAAIVRMSAAQAMYEPAPTQAVALHAKLQALSARQRMLVRGVWQRPWRALFTCLGTAGAVAILIGGTWWRDAFNHLIDVQFHAAMPADVNLGFIEHLPSAVAYELGRLPGVLDVETRGSIAVRLRSEHHSERTAIETLSEGSRLRRIINHAGQSVEVPKSGLLLGSHLADRLGVKPGDWLSVEFQEGRRQQRTVRVAGVFESLMGRNAFAHPSFITDLTGDIPSVTQASLQVPVQDQPALLEALRESPVLSAALSRQSILSAFRETSERTLKIITGVLSAFAAAIAVGVIYNSARIALAERRWELATLRVLGLTPNEVAPLLLAEIAAELLLAIPAGWLAGYAIALLMVALMSPEEFSIPMVVGSRTYGWAALVALLSGLLSAAAVWRRLATTDLIAVLKTRE